MTDVILQKKLAEPGDISPFSSEDEITSGPVFSEKLKEVKMRESSKLMFEKRPKTVEKLIDQEEVVTSAQSSDQYVEQPIVLKGDNISVPRSVVTTTGKGGRGVTRIPNEHVENCS